MKRRIRIITIMNFKRKLVFASSTALIWLTMFIAAYHIPPENLSAFSSYLTFTSQEGGFSFNYPSGFKLTAQKYQGGDILYHLDIKSDSGSAYGFIQVWNMSQPVEDFLKKSKELSKLEYKHFESKKTEVNGMTVYYWDYSLVSAGGRVTMCMEAFLEDKGRMYRISYFVPEKEWSQSQPALFMKLVESFKIL